MRGGRRGRGRVRRGGGAAAARPPRGERAAGVQVIELSDDDVKLATQTKPSKGEIAEGCAADDFKALPCDSTMEVSTKHLGRLRKRTAATGAATSELHEDELKVADVKLSNDEGGQMLPPCRSSKRLCGQQIGKQDSVGRESEDGGQMLHPCRRSKRLQRKLAAKQELSSRESQHDVFVNSEDESKTFIQQRRPNCLRKRFISEYYSGELAEDKHTSRSSSDYDYDHLPPQQRSKRLRHRMRTRYDAYDDDSDSDSVDNHRKTIPCRRMSKRLQEKQKTDHVSDESCTEASLCMLSASSSTGSDDELLRSTVKPCKSTSSGPICSICESGAGSCLLIQCQNSSCSRSFHTFCLSPPMQDTRGTLECPLCKINEASLAKGMEVYASKKIQRLVGCRRVILQESDFQYQILVKWQLLSHHHDCWVPLDWLLVFDRLRAQSYIRKNTLPKEVYMDDQRKPEWFEVDRAIACRRKFDLGLCDILASYKDNEDFEGYEFLVKWKGLDYCDATWESYSTEGVKSAVSMLVKRHQNTLRRVDCVSPMNIEGMVSENIHNDALYDYQLQGLKWMFDNFKSKRSVILADEMGLGKTVQVVSFLSHIIKGSFTTSPALVLAPKSILLQWKKEFDRWAHDLNIVVYQGDKDSRKCIQAHEMYSSERKTLFDALVTSYEIVQIDKAVLQKIKWSTIVIDEAHRLKKLDCNLASCLKKYSSEFRLLLTGTPLQNNILELFSLLHYIDPDEFSDPKADALFSPIESELDLTIDEKIARIHDILKPRMLRRMKSDVLKDSMPTKKWVEVPCALADSQRDLYINILEKNYSKLNSAIQYGRKLSLNNVLMELRKCCNHPYLFPGLEVKQKAGEDVFQSLVSASGKLQLLHKLLPKLKERGDRVLIFSQMTKMLDILEDFLSFLGYKYARIDGQTALSARQESIKEYNNTESETFIFLMSTRAGGLGIDLPGANRVIIYDPDFNPFMDLQAQSRAHRIGQTRPVVVYQLITKCSVEEKILQKSKQKLAIENMLMNSSDSKKPRVDELQSILLHGAKTIVDKKKINAVSIHYDDEAIDNLLKLDPSSGEMCTSDDNGYLGSIVSFAHGAEDVVPPSPNVEDLKVFKPATPKVDLGRGRRPRNVVKYFEEVDNEDSDDMYAPEPSSESSSSSSDDETEQEIPEVASARTEVAVKTEAATVVKLEVAPSPGSALTNSDSGSSGSSSSDDEKEEVKPVVAGVNP
ncbi:uncharacterized protein [Aegilops tauschii subsp. strangulata]|uniref:uncharacterized protein isoform X2 n=1 Tax=Aegilops tauschii subsp. strangulata TaxID=200361 RepID=UPI001ABCC2A5|nr:chromodomain-helicase-DNA-binding protein 3 isoform X2 [Aegilops tauschii subsp. strangulata]